MEAQDYSWACEQLKARTHHTPAAPAAGTHTPPPPTRVLLLRTDAPGGQPGARS